MYKIEPFCNDFLISNMCLVSHSNVLVIAFCDLCLCQECYEQYMAEAKMQFLNKYCRDGQGLLYLYRSIFFCSN